MNPKRLKDLRQILKLSVGCGSGPVWLLCRSVLFELAVLQLMLQQSP